MPGASGRAPSSAGSRSPLPVEIRQNMAGGGRADTSRAVGGRRGDRPADPGEEGVGEGMRRDAQGDAGEAGAGEVAHGAGRGRRHHEGQGAGPECLGERPCGPVEDALGERRVERGDVRDQGIEAGPLLGGVDAGDRLAAGRVGAEAVDGFGRKGDESASADEFRGAVQSGLVGREPGCHLTKAAAKPPSQRERGRPGLPSPVFLSRSQSVTWSGMERNGHRGLDRGSVTSQLSRTLAAPGLHARCWRSTALGRLKNATEERP